MLQLFRAGPWTVAGILLLTTGSWSWADPGCSSCSTCSTCVAPRVPCPPKYCWYSEGPPRLKFKCACPRPVCEPCKLEHFGYYPTCWNPWPYPPDWSHCRTPPPGVMLPPPAYPPYTPRTPYDSRFEERRPEERRPDERRPDERRPREPEMPAPRKSEDTSSVPTVRLLP